jgi:hypothetical protein
VSAPKGKKHELGVRDWRKILGLDWKDDDRAILERLRAEGQISEHEILARSQRFEINGSFRRRGMSYRIMRLEHSEKFGEGFVKMVKL